MGGSGLLAGMAMGLECSGLVAHAFVGRDEGSGLLTGVVMGLECSGLLAGVVVGSGCIMQVTYKSSCYYTGLYNAGVHHRDAMELYSLWILVTIYVLLWV